MDDVVLLQEAYRVSNVFCFDTSNDWIVWQLVGLVGLCRVGHGCGGVVKDGWVLREGTILDGVMLRKPMVTLMCCAEGAVREMLVTRWVR